MKKLLLVLIALSFTCLAYGNDEERTTSLELRLGYMKFFDDDFKNIYGDGSFYFEGVLGQQLYKNWIVEFGVGHFSKMVTAETTLGDSYVAENKISVTPLTLVLKCLLEINENLGIYLGVGPRLFLVNKKIQD